MTVLVSYVDWIFVCKIVIRLLLGTSLYITSLSQNFIIRSEMKKMRLKN